MAKKAEVKIRKQKTLPKESAKKESSIFDYLRFGESYTSLILGIIVVIIATALLLSFVHNKNAGNPATPINQQTQNTVQVSQQPQNIAKKTPSDVNDNTVTLVPTDTIVPTAVSTVAPTKAEPTVKPKPTIKPSAKPTANPTTKPTVVAMKPTHRQKTVAKKESNVWIVQKDESLWIIAEKKYTSGYNWVDIAKANNLADPSDIHVGDRLILPSVTPEQSTIAESSPTVTTSDEQNASTVATVSNKITGKSYTVVKGDTLWNIAVRAYGDGYQWTVIAKANNLANPGMIFSGNNLIIPRG